MPTDSPASAEFDTGSVVTFTVRAGSEFQLGANVVLSVATCDIASSL
jgi:hypothetical protein